MALSKRKQGHSTPNETSHSRKEPPVKNPKSVTTNYSIVVLFVLVALSGFLGPYPWLSSTLKSYILHDSVEPQAETSFFKVVELPGRGKGVIAARDISQGQLILREKPLFLVPPSISSSPQIFVSQLLAELSLTQRKSFYDLSYVDSNLPDHRGSPTQADKNVAILQTNGVAAGDSIGLFPRMARLNHGCSSAFNVVYSWREARQEIVVHAIKDIRKGEELLTTYTNTKRPRDERRQFLAQHYGFRCACAVCSLDDAKSKRSDKRLSTMSELYAAFPSWGKAENGQYAINGTRAIEIIKEIWKIGEEEGYWSERGQLANDAAWIAASHSDRAATVAWSLLAVQWYTYELGAQSDHAMGARMIIHTPESHTSWGTRERLDIPLP